MTNIIQMSSLQQYNVLRYIILMLYGTANALKDRVQICFHSLNKAIPFKSEIVLSHAMMTHKRHGVSNHR